MTRSPRAFGGGGRWLRSEGSESIVVTWKACSCLLFMAVQQELGPLPDWILGQWHRHWHSRCRECVNKKRKVNSGVFMRKHIPWESEGVGLLIWTKLNKVKFIFATLSCLHFPS